MKYFTHLKNRRNWKLIFNKQNIQINVENKYQNFLKINILQTSKIFKHLVIKFVSVEQMLRCSFTGSYQKRKFITTPTQIFEKILK